MHVTIAFDPVIARLGALQLTWHGVFSALGVYLAVWLGPRLLVDPRWRAAGTPVGVGIGAVVGAVVGARLLHVLDHLSTYAADPLSAIAIWQGGIAVYGGFIGGIIGASIGAWQAGLPVWPMLDVTAPAMLIGQAIGRLGCFSNGDAWGAATGGAWGVIYTNPGDYVPSNLLGVPTHPYPLYEAAADLALLGLLLLMRRHDARPGIVFLTGAAGYALIRFTLTFVRQEPIVFAGLQEAQVVAVITGLYAVAALAFRALQAVRAPQTSPPPVEDSIIAH
jgi:phosphatidylglycerol:prolipoprotein diacylglycerol transferase